MTIIPLLVMIAILLAAPNVNNLEAAAGIAVPVKAAVIVGVVK